MNASPERYLRLTFLLVMAGVVVAVLVVPLALGIWLPDVFIGRVHTLAEQRLASGHSFRVIQYWNHVDFYNTELLHTFPDGTVETNVLDADDNKSWSVRLVIYEPHKTATVTLSGGRLTTVNW